MNISDFKKLVLGLTPEDITTDEPHFTMRCEEVGWTPEKVKQFILTQSSRLTRIIEDRSHVYKVYYKLSRVVELKLVVDLLVYGKLNMRTIRRLDDRFRIKKIGQWR